MPEGMEVRILGLWLEGDLWAGCGRGLRGCSVLATRVSLSRIPPALGLFSSAFILGLLPSALGLRTSRVIAAAASVRANRDGKRECRGFQFTPTNSLRASASLVQRRPWSCSASPRIGSGGSSTSFLYCRRILMPWTSPTSRAARVHPWSPRQMHASRPFARPALPRSHRVVPSINGDVSNLSSRLCHDVPGKGYIVTCSAHPESQRASEPMPFPSHQPQSPEPSRTVVALVRRN
jgi:hypothetical protein